MKISLDEMKEKICFSPKIAHGAPTEYFDPTNKYRVYNEKIGGNFHRINIWLKTIDLLSGGSGYVLEFGVYNGKSINFISKFLPQYNFHGFDSFEGLQEDWALPTGEILVSKGKFKINFFERLKFNENVKIHKGFFSDTIPYFVKNIDPNYINEIKLIHMDADLKSSTIFVLDQMAEIIIKSKPMILFDEFFYIKKPNKKRDVVYEKDYIVDSGPMSAFVEFLNKYDINFEILYIVSIHRPGSSQALLKII